MTVAAVVFDLDYTLAVPDRSRQEILDEATDAAGVDAIDRQEYLGAHSDDLASETYISVAERFGDVVIYEVDQSALATANSSR